MFNPETTPLEKLPYLSEERLEVLSSLPREFFEEEYQKLLEEGTVK